MTMESVPATLLRSLAYRETSRILRFHTAERGVISTIARGIRRGSRHGTRDPGPFSSGTLDYVPRSTGDLQSFRAFHVENLRLGLGASPTHLAAASFIAELVLRHGAEGGDAPVHVALDAALDGIEQAGVASVASRTVALGWALVDALGYRPILESCARCGAAVGGTVTRFDRLAGGVLCARCSDASGPSVGPRIGPRTREAVEEMLAGGQVDALRRPSAHLRLLHDFVAFHGPEPNPLRTLEVLIALLPEERGGPTGS